MTKEVNEPNVKHPRACESISTGMKSPDKGRRQFIKKAIVTAPVILTVTSRPVWARNCTWSGQLSGNLSDAGPPCGGQGCDAGFWKDQLNADKWHCEFCKTKPFVEVFGVDAFPDGTLFAVINSEVEPAMPPGWDKPWNPHWQGFVKQLGAEAVTALQNSATSVSFDLTVCDVIAYFVDVYLNGNYETIVQATAYLNSLNTQGCPF